MKPDINELQQKIGYKFKNKSLLLRALSHSSYFNENHDTCDGSNERLEFLGDSVLGFITAENFFKNYTDFPEGDLTKLRAAMVCEKSLASFAREIQLGKYLMLGKGEIVTGGRERPSIQADAFEAVIAAIYLDGGMDEDAGQQATAAIKNRDQQKAHCGCKDDLAQIADQVHTAAVEQVDDMSNAESHAGDDDRRPDIILCDSRKQESPEDQFLQESYTEHARDTADSFRR